MCNFSDVSYYSDWSTNKRYITNTSCTLGSKEVLFYLDFDGSQIDSVIVFNMSNSTYDTSIGMYPYKKDVTDRLMIRLNNTNYTFGVVNDTRFEIRTNIYNHVTAGLGDQYSRFGLDGVIKWNTRSSVTGSGDECYLNDFSTGAWSNRSVFVEDIIAYHNSNGGCNIYDTSATGNLFLMGLIQSTESSAFEWGYIDYFNVYNMTLIDNELPTVDVGFDNDTCFNLSIGQVSLPIEVDANDAEGDTIYYSDVLGVSLSVNYTIDFTEFDCTYYWGIGTVCDYTPYYGHTYKMLNGNGYDLCNFTESEYFDTEYLNLRSILRNEGSTLFEEDRYEYGVYLTDYCTGSNYGIIYDFGGNHYRMNGNHFFMGINNGDVFNISYLNDGLEPILTIKVNKSEDDITLFYHNTSGEMIKYNTNKTGTELLIKLEYNDNDDENIFCWYDNPEYYPVISGDCDGMVFNTSEGKDLIRYLDISLESGNFWYMGSKLETLDVKDWTTTKPTSINLYDYGWFEYYIYVTDNIHIGSGEYNYGKFSFYLDECSAVGLPVDSPDLDVPVLSEIDESLGVNLRQYLINLDYGTGTDFYEIGKTIIWVIWFFIFISILVSQLVFFKGLNFESLILIPSFLCFILSWLMDYNVNMMILVVLIALGMMRGFARLFI